MPEDMPEDMPDKVPECLPYRMPEDMPDRMPEGMPDRMSDRTPEGMPDKVPECLPEHMPEDLPDRMPDRMSEDMPDRVPEDMPEHITEDMPGRMQEDMPDRMPEDMPDKMPEDMSDRMPEDLPVTKRIDRIDVMVGKTRSKVIVPLFSDQKNMLVIYPASKSISRKFSAPKVIQGRIQNGLCGHPFRSLADGAPRWAAFFGGIWLRDGWKPMETYYHFPIFYWNDDPFTNYCTRLPGFWHSNLKTCIVPGGGDGFTGGFLPRVEDAVLFPIFPPLRFVQTGRPQATEVFAIGHHCFHQDQSQPEMTIQLAVKVWARSFSGWFWYLKPKSWMLACERPNRRWAIAAEFDVYPLLDMFASSWLIVIYLLISSYKIFIDFIATPPKDRSKQGQFENPIHSKIPILKFWPNLSSIHILFIFWAF